MKLPVKIEDFVLTIGVPGAKQKAPTFSMRLLGQLDEWAWVEMSYTESDCIDGVRIESGEITYTLLKPVCHDDFSESWIIIAQTNNEVEVHNKRFYLKGTPSRESKSRDEGLSSPDDIVDWLQTILTVESVF